MNEYEMIVTVVLIVAVAVIIVAAMAARRGKPGNATARDLPAENQRLQEELTTVKKRVAVLERIATDKNHRLEHEFEQLRDS